jgi:hypothetical protein
LSVTAAPTTADTANSTEPADHSRPLSGTIIGAVPDKPFLDAPFETTPTQQGQQQATSGTTHCIKCGYYLAANSKTCPSCKTAVEIADPAPAETGKTGDTPVAPADNIAGEPGNAAPAEHNVFKGTIDPYRQHVSVPACKLKRMQSPGEHEPAQPIVIEEGEHHLNRESLDPRNNTISSDRQVLLFFKEGQWFVQDESKLQTTFIRVQSPVALKTGDILLLGDRKFEVEI